MRALLTFLVVGGFLAYVLWDLSRQGAVECNVCMQFNGRTQCALGGGPDREEAIRAGRTPVCARLANGVTESFACSATQPISVTCNSD